ncbi:sensor histidine kinase [Synechococcus sp. W4D4]|uniref:sensor histidine kinase n=1 Tax=Synechococcus sp. W4D4 TaxID=3392294 RepID=UPI0039EAC9EB
MPASSIRRHLQATSLLAVLAGYVVLLGVNRELSGRLRYDRHVAHAQATREVLERQAPADVDTPAELQELLSGLATPTLMLWMVWLQPQAAKSPPLLLPVGPLFDDYSAAHPLIDAAAQELQLSSKPHEFQLGGRFYFTSAIPIRLAGQPYELRFVQDFTLQHAQEEQLHLLLIAVAGMSALFTSALLRLVIHRGLLPLERFSVSLKGMTSSSLSSDRLSLTGQPQELRPIGNAFNDLLDRLSEAWEHQRTFVNGVSHELRTPITLISGYSRRLLRHRDQLSTADQEQLQLVADESEAMGRLVNDLLEIARDDAGRLQLECRQLDPCTVLSDLFIRLQSSSDGRLRLLPAPAVYASVSADPERLSQCLTNLVENASKYSPPASPIELCLSSDAEVVVLHVIDHGPGIPAEERQQIFERFRRGSTTGEVSGHGIGLAVVKTLMERMGGSVAVVDAPAGGADFQLRLPAVLTASSEPRPSRNESLRRWFSAG